MSLRVVTAGLWPKQDRTDMGFNLTALSTRRSVIAQMGCGVAALLHPRSSSGASHRISAEQAKGYVREAQSTQSTEERSPNTGIPGVMVSNGRDVTITDDMGFWTLPVESGDSIFVIKPPNWTYVQTSGIPQFSYLHQPGGTPRHLNLNGPVLDATGALPQEITFFLKAEAEPQHFDVLLVADTQAANAAELAYVRKELLAHTRGTGARFAINHGDVMGDDLSLLAEYRDIVSETGIVWHHCPGNHDLNLDSPGPAFACESWKRFIGPTHYAFQHAGATFILLNNIDYLGRGAALPNGRAYRGSFGERQLAFVQNVLKHVPVDQLVVVSMHIPMVSFESPDNPSDMTVDRRQLLALLAERPNTLSFAGHSHTTEHHYLGPDDGFARATPHHHHVLTAFCGCWWGGPHDDRGIPVADSRDGSPRGFHILSVRGNTYTTKFVPVAVANDRDLRVILHNPESSIPKAGRPLAAEMLERPLLLVDVFDGGPRTRVTCEVEGQSGLCFELSRSRIPDPYIVHSFANNREHLKPWVEASVSSHIWTAPIPGALLSGSHSCSIRVVTEYGDEHHRAYTLTAGT